MVNKTINELDPGVPTDVDEMEMQTAGGGLSFKATLGAVVNARQALGEVHSNADFTHGAITTTPIPLQGYDSSLTAIGVTVILTPVGGSNTAKFVINVNRDGPQRITFNIDVESIGTAENVDFVLYHTPFATGIPTITEFKASVDMSQNAIDRGTASINTFISAVVGDEFEMYANSDGITFNDLLVDSLTFTIERR